RLAGTAGIEAPVHGMVYCPDGTRTYFIKRFDRSAKGGKVPVEDFAQLSGRTRDTKYDSSMEKVADVVGRFCTFPVVEKLKLFRLTLFNYLTGNEDAHLKNFSLITRDGIVGLSPVYDLLNTTIVLDRPIEEVALPIDGRKKNLSRSLFVNYFGKERLGLTGGTVDEVLSGLARGMREWEELIGISFLTDRMKERYLEVLGVRRKILEI
ncbi:MAG TPA: HipA domain-containing protein, partial [Bacteroidota bacterium]|nr:HipA domain-containing protein [Bacteroidota bacterium]